MYWIPIGGVLNFKVSIIIESPFVYKQKGFLLIPVVKIYYTASAFFLIKLSAEPSLNQTICCSL